MSNPSVNFKNIEDIHIGDTAYYAKTVTEANVMMFASLSGDYAPQHVSKAFGETTMFQSRIAHGMLTVGLVGPVLNKLCGDNSMTTFQNIRFRSAVVLGDTVNVCGKVTDVNPDTGVVTMDVTCTRQHAKPEDRPFITGVFKQKVGI